MCTQENTLNTLTAAVFETRTRQLPAACSSPILPSDSGSLIAVIIVHVKKVWKGVISIFIGRHYKNMKRLNENMINAVGLWSPNFISCNMVSPSESGSRLPASAAITSASVDCSPPWRPNSYLFQIQHHQIHSHYLCDYHFLKNLLVCQS